jgi:hypothetical protein
VKNPQQTSTDGLVESFWCNRDLPPLGWKSIREFVRRAYLAGLSFLLARQLVDTSPGTVVVPWAFVLSNDEPSAKELAAATRFHESPTIRSSDTSA